MRGAHEDAAAPASPMQVDAADSADRDRDGDVGDMATAAMAATATAPAATATAAAATTALATATATATPSARPRESEGGGERSRVRARARGVKLDKDIILYIMRLACQMRLRDELMRRSTPARRRLVQAHRHDVYFMEVAVSVDRLLLEFADPASPHFGTLQAIAVRPVLQSIRTFPFEILPADPKVHLGDQPRRWQLRLGHLPQRSACIRLVGAHLIGKRPTASNQWVEEFHAMLPRVERSIYLASNSLDEYADPETLPERVKMLFEKIAHLAENAPPSPSLQWLEATASPENPEHEHDSDQDDG